MGQKRRVYSKEFKEQVVLLSETSGKLVTEIAQDLGILKTCSGAGDVNTGNPAIKVFQATGIVNQETS